MFRFLISGLIYIFKIAKSKCLTADRELIGDLWFAYLHENLIHFRIRNCKSLQVVNAEVQLVMWISDQDET